MGESKRCAFGEIFGLRPKVRGNPLPPGVKPDFTAPRFHPPPADITHPPGWISLKKALAEASAFFWSWYPDSNWGPHPYQLLYSYFIMFFSCCGLKY
ncbi:MAG: hypothetical protein IKD93_03415 [Firmicutes bacterium]|nr:hypothetical protein [Bacillota bacterium]